MKILPQRKSIRLPKWDYSQSGYYFITVCTHNRICLFGKIIDGKMVLDDIGEMIQKWLMKIPERFKNTTLDECQIMPNHLHIIIVIGDKTTHRKQSVGVGSPDPLLNVFSNPHIGRGNPVIGRGNPAPTLGQIVAYLKYQSTKQINILNKTPGQRLFQRNYYEHIIRNENDLNEIREYIKTNPQIWDRDRNNPKNWEKQTILVIP